MEPRFNQSSATQLKEKASELVTDVREIGHLARDAAREKIEEAYAQGRDTTLGLEKKLEQNVCQRPLTSLAIAGGLGLLLGMFCRRR